MPLTVLITSQDGRVSRCGPDEPDAAWIPEAIWFESVIPGGWKGAGFNLRQRIDEDLGLRLLNEVEIVDEHGQTAYEGFIVKLPRQHGGDYLLGVECLGFAATMLFDPSVPYFYVDPLMSNWHEASLTRQKQISTSGGSQGKIPVQAAQGGVVWNPPNEALPAGEDTEVTYTAPPGQTIAKLGYKGARAGSFANFESPDLFTDDTEDFATGAVNTALTLDDTVREATVSAPQRYAMLRCRVGVGHTPAAGVQQRYSKLAPHGNHGLTSAAVAGSTNGYYIDDMLVHALTLACPKLSVASVADGGLVERPPLVVGQAADNELGSVERIVLDLNKYVLYEWGVYRKREFFYRATDPDRVCWEARLDRGIHLGLEGDDAEHALNGMLVRYQLSDGTSRVAGPTGSGLDVESDLLGDADPDNSVTAHGYPRKWGDQTVSFPLADDLYATVIGAAYLAQAALPARSGDIRLVGEVEHPTKGMRPVREVLAGDWVRLSDHPADVPRRIISVRYTDDDRTALVTVGNDMDKVDAILEQVGVKTKLVVG